jgi:hypothetical protein
MVDIEGQRSSKIRIQHAAHGICWQHALNATFKVNRSQTGPRLPSFR